MPSRFEKLFSIKPTERVERLRKYYQGLTSVYKIDIDRIITRVMRDTEGEPMVLRRAHSFAAVVRELPIDIFPDEPFVGWLASAPAAVNVVSHQRGPWFDAHIDQVEIISDEDRKELKEDILPYWKGNGKWERTRMGRAFGLFPEATCGLLWPGTERTETKMVFTDTPGIFGELMSHTHVGHGSYGHEKVLKKGFLGIKRDAEERLGRIDHSNPDELQKVPFLKGVIIAMEAAAEIGKRFAALARERAKKEKDAQRKAELLKMAEICDRVPASPPRTFHEALQCVWFTHILNWYETPGTGGMTVGRIDQFLYPYYENDVKEGCLTKEEAQELVDCWLMRFAQDASRLSASVGVSHHIDVGGLKPDGSDASNELSHIFIEGVMHARMEEPNFGVLVHSKTPDNLLIKASELCSMGIGHPMFVNHDGVVENLLGRGTMGGPPVTLELARKAGVIGCNEPCVTNMDSGYVLGALVPMPAVLELALNNGVSPRFGKKLGAETGDPRKFESFEEVREAVRAQLSYVLGHVATVTNICELALAEMHPTVYQSALIEDCIENGVPREAGGARYNFGPGIGTLGVVDVGDSLTAIKRLVFEEKKITMAELCDALEKDFEGYDELHSMLVNAPKFGNDDDYVDEQVAWVLRTYSDEVTSLRNTRGGRLLPVQIPLASYVPFGMMTSALPSGRKAGRPLSDGVSPTQGNDVNGPTAILRSVGKLDNIRMFLGQTLNMKLSPEMFKDEQGVKRFADLIRTFVDQKIHHIQFNVVSSDTLRAAQNEPEKHKDLLVRVAGYCTYFVWLGKEIQDSIIARTEHGFSG